MRNLVGGKNRVFLRLFLCFLACENLPGDIWDTGLLIETFRVRWKTLRSSPFVASVSHWMFKCMFFRGNVGVFRWRGNTFISYPRHSHSVEHTHTHTHTHKNTHKGINCRWYDLSYCPTATRHLSRSYYYQVHSCWLSLIATGKYFKGSVHPNYSKSKKKHIFSLTLVQGSAAFTIIPQQENLQNITVSYNEGNEAKKV